MEFEIWHIWIIAGVLLFIIEIFTPAFVAASIGIGALFGGLAAVLNLDIKIQLLFFSVGTLISFLTVRPLFMKYAYKKAGKIKTNIDNLVGKVGKVSETIDHSEHTGRVAIDGDDWKAQSVNNVVIDKGEKVEVTKIESIILTVKKTN